MSRWRMPTRILFVCALYLLNGIAAAENLRTFGYVIGDIIEQKIPLVRNNIALELSSLPKLERVDLWLDRQTAELTVDSSDNHYLLLRYQVINAPVRIILASLPALSLPVTNSDPLQVDPIPVSLSPLTLPSVPGMSTQQLLMQPDNLPVAPDAALPVKRFKIAAAVLLATLLCWVLWWFWRERRDSTRLPFARAFGEIRKLGAAERDSNETTWLALHQAFNDTAGRAVSRGMVPQLLDDAAWLQPYKQQIETFYSVSTQRFFQPDADNTKFAAFDLCKILTAAEKRQGGA